MNRVKSLIAITAFSLVVLALPSVASAQWGGNNRNDGYYGNNRYNRNIQGTVRNLKNRARSFENAVDRFDNRQDDRYGRNDRYGRGGYGSDNLERLADDFKNAADRFENRYGSGRNLNNSADEARRLLDIGSQIDQALYRTRNRNLENQWNQISNDLRIIADVYGFNYNNRNNRNRNGNWRNNVPFPLPF